MSEDTVIELYGAELLAIHTVLKDTLWTGRVPAEHKHIKHFINRPDVKHAIECHNEE